VKNVRKEVVRRERESENERERSERWPVAEKGLALVVNLTEGQTLRSSTTDNPTGIDKS